MGVQLRNLHAGLPAGYPFGIEPIYAGLGTSLAIYAAGWTLTKEHVR